MDLSLFIRQRLKELRLEQKDLAVSAQVTESYISQLLARKKTPPAPGRTDIYERLGRALGIEGDELSRLADVQRKEELRRKIAGPPRPLFREFRALIVRKCDPAGRKEVSRIFEKEPFGELERLTTQKLLDAAQAVAREELRGEAWLRRIAELRDRSYEQMRVALLEFLDADLLSVSAEDCSLFLDPTIDFWEIDLKTFAMRVVLNGGAAGERVKHFEFVEREAARPLALEPGFEEFLHDSSLSGDAGDHEIEFLKSLKFRGRRPSALYYYRELQSLRDPLHFTQ